MGNSRSYFAGLLWGWNEITYLGMFGELWTVNKNRYLKILLWLLPETVFFNMVLRLFALESPEALIESTELFFFFFSLLNFFPLFLITGTSVTKALLCSDEEFSDWGRTAHFQMLVLPGQFSLPLCASVASSVKWECLIGALFKFISKGQVNLCL